MKKDKLYRCFQETLRELEQAALPATSARCQAAERTRIMPEGRLKTCLRRALHQRYSTLSLQF